MSMNKEEKERNLMIFVSAACGVISAIYSARKSDTLDFVFEMLAMASCWAWGWFSREK